MTEKAPRTKEQYEADVREWAAEKELDETQTQVIVRVATFVGQKKIAAEMGITVYRVQKIVQSIREKVGWSDKADTMRMGWMVMSCIDPRVEESFSVNGKYLYADLMKREEQSA